MLEVLYTPNFVRQHKKLLPALQQEVKEKIALFKEDPTHTYLKTHKLQGKLKGFWSFSVNYEYRIIFEYDAKTTVALVAVGNHDIYQ